MATYDYQQRPNTWQKHILHGLEVYIHDDGYSLDAYRCEICKKSLKVGHLCEDEGCRTILSMMDPDPYRIRIPSPFEREMNSGRPSIRM
jgi:hypothetical protein